MLVLFFPDLKRKRGKRKVRKSDDTDALEVVWAKAACGFWHLREVNAGKLLPNVEITVFLPVFGLLPLLSCH